IFSFEFIGPGLPVFEIQPFFLGDGFSSALVDGNNRPARFFFFFTNCLAVCCWLLLSVLLGKALFKKGIKTFEGAGA
ncbi:ABC transporter permease, partial [Lactobacillus delbrueckii subsp. bulgaricus]